MTYDDVRALAVGLEGVTEGTYFRTPALFRGKKFFVRLCEDGETIVLRASPEDVIALPKTEPAIYSVPEHYAGWGMVVVNLPAATARKLEPYLHASWERSAMTRSPATPTRRPRA